MRIRIKAPFKGAETSGIYGANAKEIPIGTELDFDEEPIGWAGRYDIVSGGDADGKTPVTNPSDKKAIYEVKENQPGWFVVTKDGAEVTKNFRKAELEGFDAMSDDDKEAFVDLHKKEA